MNASSHAQIRLEPTIPERSHLLLGINNAIVTHLELAPLLKAVSECLRRELPHDFAGLAIYDPEIRQLRVHGLNFAAAHPHFAVGEIVPIEGTPAGLAFTSRKTVLRHKPDPNEFFDELAVQNVLNYGQLQETQREVARERARSKLLLEVNNAIVTHLNLSDLLSAVSARLNGLLPHDSTFIALRQPDGIHLQTKAQFLGKLKDLKFTEGLLVPMEGTPEERVIQTGKPVLVGTISELGSFPSPWVRHALDVGIKSGCSVPLRFHGEILGVLGITSLQERAFKPEDVTLLEQCATQIAIALQNALNFESAQQAERQVRH
jgi:hypothetical protein